MPLTDLKKQLYWPNWSNYSSKSSFYTPTSCCSHNSYRLRPWDPRNCLGGLWNWFLLWGLFGGLLRSRRRITADCFSFNLDSQIVLKSTLVSCLKFLASEPFLCVGMRMNWYVAGQVHKISLDGDDSPFCFDVAASWHAFSVKDGPPSMGPNVLVELAIVYDLYSKRVLGDGFFAFFTPPPTWFGGFHEYSAWGHK